AHGGDVEPCANSKDCPTASGGPWRRLWGRGSNRGSRVWRASGLGFRPCWLLCTGERNSSADADGCADQDEITSGSICIYGDPHEPYRPLLEGDIIGLRGGRLRTRWIPRATRAPISTLQPQRSALALIVDVRTVGFWRKQSRCCQSAARRARWTGLCTVPTPRPTVLATLPMRTPFASSLRARSILL